MTLGNAPRTPHVGSFAFLKRVPVEVRREDVQVRQRGELVQVLTRDRTHDVVCGEADGGQGCIVAIGRLTWCARTRYAHQYRHIVVASSQ